MQIFKPIVLVKNLPVTIECLSAHNDCLVVTTKQGHLMKYRFTPKRNAQLSSKTPEIEIELIDSHKQFSKKPVSQMETVNVPELRIIITLSDGLIHVNDFDDLSLTHQIIQKTKGATCFATNLQTQMTLTGKVQYMLRMCVVVKKKIILWYWKNKNFHEMSKEINLNDQPRAVAWCAESLFVGYKSEYELIKLTGESPESEIKNLSATGGKQPEPIIKLLQNDKVSINRDENTYILDQNGDPYLKYSITWSDIPLNIAEDYPYLVSLLPSSIIEIKTIEPHLFIQRLELAQMTSNFGKIKILTKCTSRKGLIIAASTNDIFAIVAIPLDQQKAKMVTERHFELALRLANMEQKDTQQQQDPSSTRDIELQYAHDLFNKGSYREALDLFFKLDISPLLVIKLFPELADEHFTEPDPVMSPGSGGSSGKSAGINNQSSSKSSSSNHFTSNMSIKSGGGTSLIGGNGGGGDSNDEPEERLTALIGYLIQIRRKISSNSARLQASGAQTVGTDNSSSADGGGSSLRQKKDEPRGSVGSVLDNDEFTLNSHMKTHRALERLKQEVDTTLLKCYLKTTNALVASLLRLPDNHCILKTTERALKKYHKYNELIILFQSRGLHRRALDLLKSHYQDSPISGYEKTVQYLQHLGQDQLEIICEYARWVIENDPELGLKIFTADLSEAEQLDRNLVLEFLRHNAPSMEIPYLEHIIHFWNDKTSLFHTTLLLRYRQKVAPLLAKYLESIGDQVPCPAGQEPGELGELRRKLLDFLEISDHYTTQGLPALLMNEGLYEERAIVVGKLGQHEEALSIFIYVLNNPKRAEEYCLSVYKKRLPNSEDIFFLLLKLYIHPPQTFSSTQLQRKMSVSSAKSQSLLFNESNNYSSGSSGPMMMMPTNTSHLHHHHQLPNFSAKIVKLLNEHGDKIDPLKAIAELPNEFDLVSLRDYLNGTFCRKLQESHEKEMFRQLVMAKFYQVQKNWIQLQRANKILIDDSTVCQVCNKRIGRSAFARFPNLDLVHYSCKDRYGKVVKATLPSFDEM